MELCQPALIAAAFPLVARLRLGKHERRAVIAISVLLALFGSARFTDRAFNLGAMRFEDRYHSCSVEKFTQSPLHSFSGFRSAAVFF